MYVERETREKFNALSKIVWGSPSHWMKYLTNGIIIPSEAVHPRSGAPVSSERRWHTEESLYELMQTMHKYMQESLIKKI